MKSILIIDDDVVTRTVLRDLLSTAGYATLVASDGRQGLTLYENRPVDLIITDIFMPGHNGFEVIKTLQAKDPGLKIIAISGDFLSKSDQDRSLRETLGVLKTFAKPFDPDALMDYVNGVLQGTDEMTKEQPPLTPE